MDANGVSRGNVDEAHQCPVTTIFGEVDVIRLAYRRRGYTNLYPADGALNLPAEKHSHGLRKLATMEASRGSFQDAVEAIQQATGQRLGQAPGPRAHRPRRLRLRRRLRLTSSGPGDARRPAGALPRRQADCVMRPEALREATREAAARASPKLTTRLSKGELGQPEADG